MGKKTVLITGSTSGIGLAGAEALARKGWRVLVHARSEERGAGALTRLRAAVPEGDFDLVTGDLASLKSVADLAQQVVRKTATLDALWNNAGGMQTQRLLSADGVELQMAVNHLAPFTLTSELLPLLRAAPTARVVATSSMAHAFARRPSPDWFADRPDRYEAFGVYGKSKLANILFTQELQRRLAGSTVTAHAFHPGWVRTGFGSGSTKQKASLFSVASTLLAIGPEKGCDTGVFLVEADSPVHTPGLYWDRRKPKKPAGSATLEAAADLWAQSEALVSRVLGGSR